MEMNLEPRSVAGLCGLILLSAGVLFLSLGLCAEHSLRKGEVRDAIGPMFVSARRFTLIAGLMGYLYLFVFVLSPWLCKLVPGIVVLLIWVSTAGALCSAILRFFQKKPGS